MGPIVSLILLGSRKDFRDRAVGCGRSPVWRPPGDAGEWCAARPSRPDYVQTTVQCRRMRVLAPTSSARVEPTDRCVSRSGVRERGSRARRPPASSSVVARPPAAVLDDGSPMAGALGARRRCAMRRCGDAAMQRCSDAHERCCARFSTRARAMICARPAGGWQPASPVAGLRRRSHSDCCPAAVCRGAGTQG